MSEMNDSGGGGGEAAEPSGGVGAESTAETGGGSGAEAPGGEAGERGPADADARDGPDAAEGQPEGGDASEESGTDVGDTATEAESAAETASYAPEVGEVGPPKTGPEITGQKVPASEVPGDKGRWGENGGGGRGDDSLTNKFNAAAAGKRPAPPATTGTEGRGGTAKGAGSDLGGGPGIDPTFTATEKPLKEDEPLPNYPGVKVSEDPDAKGRNVNRPKGPKL